MTIECNRGRSINSSIKWMRRTEF